MEDQASNVIIDAINQLAVVLVPLAVAGASAWISPFVSDGGKLAPLMWIINIAGGNVRKAANKEN